MTVVRGPLETYFRTLANADGPAASELVLDLLDEGTPLERITSDVLVPAQVRVGQMWEQGTWSVADEHAATAVTETALSALTAAAGRRRRRSVDRHVVVACAEGEWHTLPARMAATIGIARGARVTVLGPSLPTDDLASRLAAGDVDVLALSCTLPPNLLGAARFVQAAHAAGVPVLAGGRAFGGSARRAHAIGADAWAERPDEVSWTALELAHRDTVIPAESVLLDVVDDVTVSLAFDRLVATFPRLRQLTPFQQARTREDLRWMARFTAATVLTDDTTVLDDFLSWLSRLLDGRVPVDVIVVSAHVMADAVEPFAPIGSAALHQAALPLGSRP